MAKKKTIDLGFTPSPYQEKIFDFVQHGVGNAVIRARAGVGKTLTIISAMKLVPKSKKCLFIAFNKSIVEELTKKLEGYDNCTVKTIHSLGYLIVRRNLGSNIEIDEYKYRTYLKQHINELTSIAENIHMTRQMVSEYIDSITMLIDYSRFNVAQSVKEIEQVAARYDIPVSFDECEVALKCLKWGKENYQTIDYTDMVWLPYELSLKPSGLQFDWIFFDEAQDASQMSIELFTRCFKRGTRFVAVGDENQCQPCGTKILMSDGTEKNIEDIRIGDKIVTYQEHDKCRFANYKISKYNSEKFGSFVEDISVSKSNRLLKITTSKGLTSSYTFDHICYAKFNQEATRDKYIVYLMSNNKSMYRIGTTQFYKKRTRTMGLRNRMVAENCDNAWILKVCNNEHEAKIYETLYSFKYGIPQIIFQPERACTKLISSEDVNFIYNNINDIEDRAIRCLNDFRLDIRFPFVVKNDCNNKARNYMFTTRACNLIPNYMEVRVFDENDVRQRPHGNDRRPDKYYIGHFEDIVKIEYDFAEKNVFSLKVTKDKNYVADKILTHNCINLFAGSSPEAFDYLCNYPNTTVFDLPITYRCSKKITEFANHLVPDMQYREDAPDGFVVNNCHVNEIKDGDMVLARSKAPLIKLYIKLLRRGVNCYIKGQDIGNNLIKLLEDVEANELNVNLKKDGVFVRLYDKLFTDRNKLMEKRGLDMNDATLSMNIMNMYDSLNALIILAEKCRDKYELIEHIRQIFKEEAKGVCLSTIHKAKGLEAENVYILCHSMMPSKLAHHDWEKLQERNLQYVAYTRPKNKLGFISEKEVPPVGSMLEPTAILDELKYIENNVCKILGKEPMQAMNETEIAKFNIKTSTEIEDFHANDNKLDITNNVYVSNENTTETYEDDMLLNQLLEFMQKGNQTAVEKDKN